MSLCEECQSRQGELICFTCNASYCKVCHCNTHKSKVLKSHPNAPLQPGFNRIESALASAELLAAQEIVLRAAKKTFESKEIDSVLSKIEDGLKQQNIAVSLWDYDVEKIKTRLDKTLGSSISTIRTEMNRILNEAVAYKIEELEPLLRSHMKLQEVMAMIDKSLKDAEGSLTSSKRDQILGSKRLIEASLVKTKEAREGIITQIESKLMLKNALESAEKINSLLDTLNPENLVALNFESAVLVEQISEFQSKHDFVSAYNTALKASKFNAYEVLTLLARYCMLGYKSLAENGKLEPEPIVAYDWCIRASIVKPLDGEMCFFLGKLSLENLELFSEGKDWLIKGAEQGNPESIVYLAFNLDLDEDEKSYWLNKALEMNNPDAFLYLAKRYESLNSNDLALDYYMKSASGGNSEAQLKLAEFCASEKDDASAFQWLFAAANKVEDANVFFNLARRFQDGFGCSMDLSEAIVWYRKSARLGHAEAQYILATLLESKDAEESMEWFQKAADQGISEAQLVVGMHLKSVNIEESMQWLEKAAASKNPLACLELGKLKKKNGNFGESIALFNVACEGGLAEAYFEMAIAYITGQGVQEDEFNAESCLIRSADLGFILAREMRKTATTKGASKKALLRFINSIEISKDSSAVSMPEPAIIDYMFKMSKKGKTTFHKRLFVLHGPFFCYYKDSGDSYASYRMLLRGARVDRLISFDKPGEYHFLIVNAQNEELHVFCNDLQIVEKWFDAVERSILYYTFVDTKTQFPDVESKPDEEMLPEENRFNSSMWQNIIKCGWLQKQGGKRKNCNKRWFILVQENLFYFKEEDRSANPEGGIPLEYAQIIVNASNIMGIDKKHTIVILTHYRNYFISANTSEEMIEWANAIESVVDQATARVAVNFDNLKAKVGNSEAFRTSLFTRPQKSVIGKDSEE